MAATLSPEAYDGFTLRVPAVGDHALVVVSPTLLELRRVNTKAAAPARVDSWDFVDSNNTFTPPSLSDVEVRVEGKPVAVEAIGFRRRTLYAPLRVRDFRIGNSLFLRLTQPLTSGQSVAVLNPGGNLWPPAMVFSGSLDPARFSPAIHVNQEGYTTGLNKKAKVGYYLGTLGELPVSAQSYSLVSAATGATAYTGTLTSRLEAGWALTPLPYQKVLEADFSGFDSPGLYQLLVPGLGVSETFRIGPGLAMDHARALALGLYHQRCGSANELPFTRHTHAPCHTALAEIPVPAANFPKAWQNIASANADYANNPRHTAPRLATETDQLYPFVRSGKVDVSGGHHDAGDYSKYTINSALLIESLTFAADNFAGAGALDNLGLPESGDGRSDLLQEAKIEADYLLKLQDTDGGFSFLIYPRDRKYEDNVLPDAGDSQILYPKNTSATASATAALARLATSPRFKNQFPAEAAQYRQAAQAGWSFLVSAIATYGKDGSYQKLTHYGDVFMHDDELAWAACEMFILTGDPAIHDILRSWYPTPNSKNMRRWTWWANFEAYGCANRAYAFAARCGRLSASQLDASYLAKCEAELITGAEDWAYRSRSSAYGPSFDAESKRSRVAGWIFSSDRAFDIAVGYQLNPKADYLDAILANLNFEAGCNPVNVSYVTGLGSRQQREVVHQYAQNDRRVLPPSGLPQGNIAAGFMYLSLYGSELGQVSFPGDGAQEAPYPFYDRWGDSFNTSNEFVVTNQGRGLGTAAMVAALTPLASQAWTSASGQISTPPGYSPVGLPATFTLSVPGLDLTDATIVWEAPGEEPSYGGATYTFSPGSVGTQWIEAEAHWPDGRRVAACATYETCLNNTDGEFTPDAQTVALYHFNGNYQDSSANGYHLTASGNVTLASDNLGWNGQPTGQVVRFNGAGSMLTVQVPDAKLQPGNAQSPMTIEARIYPRAYCGYSVGDMAMVSLYQNWDSSFELKDRKWNSPNAPLVMVGNNTVVSATQWNTACAKNTWHKLKITLAANGTIQTFLDDQLVSSGTATLVARNNAWTLTLGNFVGDLDEVRFSNVVR